MSMQRRVVPVAGCALLLISLSATRFVSAPPHTRSALMEPDACTLLSGKDAAAALEVSSAKVHPDASNPKLCTWSNDPAASDSSRRVVLVIVSPRAFQIAMRPAIATIKIEPVSGIGDETFYQIYPNASPFIWVRKGNAAFTIRILIGAKPRPFTIEQEKPKEATLAKVAVAKL